MDPRRAIASLFEPDRLAVAGSLVDARRTVDELVEHTGRDRRTVLQALGELRAADIVSTVDETYTITIETLRALGEGLRREPEPMDPMVGWGMTDDEREVLARFFVGGRLTAVPAGRMKRLVVLERLALEFEVGRHYTEAEVNDLLGQFHEDTATLRRYLVDEELLDRDRESYWRSGGRVEHPSVDDPGGSG